TSGRLTLSPSSSLGRAKTRTSCSVILVELAIRHGWLHVHRHQADVERLCVVEVVHAPVFGPEPFDDLWYGLVNGLLSPGRPFRDVPDLVRVHAIPEGLQAVHDLLAVH